MTLYTELDTAWAELMAPGAPFEIETITVRGVPLRSFRQIPNSVRDVWLPTVAFAEREYLVYEDERVTYAQAHAAAAAVANWLQDRGVKTGDRIAIAMRNYPEWLLIYWGALSIGVTVVGMNAWWTAAELAYGMKDSAPKVVFADAERLPRLEGLLGDAALVTVRADPPAGAVAWADVVARGGTMPDAEIDPDSDACIFYTSGTTGAPKGAQQTHRGIVTNLMNMMFAGQADALAIMRFKGIDPASVPVPAPPVSLVTTPMFHVTACNCAAYAATSAGGKMVLMYRWDPGVALELIEREKIGSMTGVPTMGREQINHPDFAKRDTSSLVSLSGGGAQVPPDLVGRIDREGGNARPRTGYGMTETCGIITSVSSDFFVDKPASCGRAMPSFETRVVDDDGKVLAQGEAGELEVRGAAVIKGYLNRPEATADSIHDGWLKTGDVARIDETGFIFIVDRKKDMVLRGGENVYCAEVEAAVYQHPAVAECSVFGVPDERLGEEVGAAVVLRPGETVTAAELRAHVATLIAKHKAPRYVWLLDKPLPQNANGKFLKRELRDSLKLEDVAA